MAFFVIRATDAKMKRLLGHDLPQEETFDTRVTRYLTRSQSKKKYLHPKSADRYRYIYKEVTFDYLPVAECGEYEISLRVLLFPIGNGTYENLIKTFLKANSTRKKSKNFACQHRFQVAVSLHTGFNEQNHCVIWQVFFIPAYLPYNKTKMLPDKWLCLRHLFQDSFRNATLFLHSDFSFDFQSSKLTDIGREL